MKAGMLLKQVLRGGALSFFLLGPGIGAVSADERDCSKPSELSPSVQAVIQEVRSENERLFSTGQALNELVYSKENYLDFTHVESKSTALERRDKLRKLKNTWKALADLQDDFETAVIDRGLKVSLSRPELFASARCFAKAAEQSYTETDFGNIDRFIKAIRARQNSAEALEDVYSLIAETFGSWTLSQDGLPAFKEADSNHKLRRLLVQLVKADEEAKRLG